jgi:hypothetical protein
MFKFWTKATASALTGIAVAGAGVSTALAYSGSVHHASTTSAEQTVNITKQPTKPAGLGKTMSLRTKGTDRKDGRAAALPSALPGGTSTGTSFWDPSTASGKPMSYHTLASPYWPLGTTVKIMYGNKSAIGVVEDFGPAEWAVAQHNPPAIVDLSEKMMADLTGVRSNSVTIKFQVLKLGDGPVYRHGGTGYDMATGVSGR